MAVIPSDKLRTNFGWLLNDVSDDLSKTDCRKIAYAEQLPKSMIIPDCEDFHVELLHLLQARGRFGPLNPEGLIEILKKAKKNEAIKKVQQYKAEQRYKEELKEHQKLKKKRGHYDNTENPAPENMEEFEKMLATMKTKTFSVLNTLTKAVIKTESIFEQYKNGHVLDIEVKQSFQRLSEVMEKSTHIMQKAISGSSVGSTDSTDSNNGSPVEEHLAVVPPPPFPLLPDDDNYYEVVQALMPVQETESNTTDHSPETSRRRQKPKPLPRTKRAQTALLMQAPPPPKLADEENDFTGGTGDSGVGSGESDRMTWIQHSQLPGDIKY